MVAPWVLLVVVAAQAVGIDVVGYMKQQSTVVLASVLQPPAELTTARRPAGKVVRSNSQPQNSPTSATAQADIPPRYLRLYRQAGRDYHIPWQTLAGIGKVESNHGRTTLPGVHFGSNYAGACGPMQIGCIPGSKAGNSWAVYGRGGDVHKPEHAIPGAARYLNGHGAQRNLDRAIYGYNHDWGYVALVKSWARRYGRSRP